MSSMDDLPPEFLTAEFATRVGGMKRYFTLVDRWYARQAPVHGQKYQSRDDGSPAQEEDGFWYRQMKRGAQATALGGILVTRYRWLEGSNQHEHERLGLDSRRIGLDAPLVTALFGEPTQRPRSRTAHRTLARELVAMALLR